MDRYELMPAETPDTRSRSNPMGMVLHMGIHSSGEWVKYDDHLKALALARDGYQQPKLDLMYPYWLIRAHLFIWWNRKTLRQEFKIPLHISHINKTYTNLGHRLSMKACAVLALQQNQTRPYATRCKMIDALVGKQARNTSLMDC